MKNGEVLLVNDLWEITDLKNKLPTISNELLDQIEESVMESVNKV